MKSYTKHTQNGGIWDRIMLNKCIVCYNTRMN